MPFVSTILCVDDDEDDLAFVRDVIHSQHHDFIIEEASNGLEAINFLDRSVKKQQLPCLIIMDINMPKMDGRQTINRIKEIPELQPVPIVIFTTSANPADQEYFEKKGIHFITKPYDYKVFREQIVDLLGFCADLGH